MSLLSRAHHGCSRFSVSLWATFILRRHSWRFQLLCLLRTAKPISNQWVSADNLDVCFIISVVV